MKTKSLMTWSSLFLGKTSFSFTTKASLSPYLAYWGYICLLVCLLLAINLPLIYLGYILVFSGALFSLGSCLIRTVTFLSPIAPKVQVLHIECNGACQVFFNHSPTKPLHAQLSPYSRFTSWGIWLILQDHHEAWRGKEKFVQRLFAKYFPSRKTYFFFRDQLELQDLKNLKRTILQVRS